MTSPKNIVPMAPQATTDNRDLNPIINSMAMSDNKIISTVINSASTFIPILFHNLSEDTNKGQDNKNRIRNKYPNT